MKQKNIVRCHNDNDLKTASDYLEYHVRMYVETLIWLRVHTSQVKSDDTLRNAMLESHLVHGRLLIDFLQKSKPREDDIVAIDYFHDLSQKYSPQVNDFLKDCAADIGGYLVHITRKPMPALKSQQYWPIDKIASQLLPMLTEFLVIVPDKRLAEGVREDCMNHLSSVSFKQIYVSVHAST